MSAPEMLNAEQVRQVIERLVEQGALPQFPYPAEVFDTAGAAFYLRMSPQNLELYRVNGGGPRFVKLGRLVRYRRAALDEWLIAHERAHSSEGA